MPTERCLKRQRNLFKPIPPMRERMVIYEYCSARKCAFLSNHIMQEYLEHYRVPTR